MIHAILNEILALANVKYFETITNLIIWNRYMNQEYHCTFVVHANDNVCVSITNDTSIRQSQTSLDTNTYTK